MAIDILDILQRKHTGEPAPVGPDLNELIAGGAQIDYGPQPEPSFRGELVRGLAATPETMLASATGIASTIFGGLAGLGALPFVGPEGATNVVEAVQNLRFKPSGVAEESTEALATLGGGVLSTAMAGYLGTAVAPFVGLDEAGRIIEEFAMGGTPVPTTEGGQKVVDVAMKPFEIVRESSDWWGKKISDATGSPELGAAAAVAIESAALFGTPSLVKGATPIARSNLLKLRRKLGTAQRTGNFGDPGLQSVLHDILADMKADPAMRANVERYLEQAQAGSRPPGGQLAEPRPPTANELVRQRMERRRMAKVAGVEEPAVGARLIGEEAVELPAVRPLVTPEPVRPAPGAPPVRVPPRGLIEAGRPPVGAKDLRLPLQEGMSAAELLREVPEVLIDPAVSKPFRTQAWEHTRQQRSKLSGAEDVRATGDMRSNLPEFKNTNEALDFAKTATEDHIVEATLRRQQHIDNASKAMETNNGDLAFAEATKGQFYREMIEEYGKVQGGGKPSPVKSDFNTQAKKYGVEYRGPEDVKTLSAEGVEASERMHRYYDPQTKEYFTVDSVKNVAKELEQHRANIANKVAKYEGMTLDDFARVTKDWFEGGDFNVADIKAELQEFINTKPRNDFATAADYMDFIDRGEELLGIINKGMRERGTVPPERPPTPMVTEPTVPEPVRVADVKLNDGNIAEPKMIKPEDRIAYMKEFNKKRSNLKQEQIEAALEEGTDIANMLPDEAQAAYREHTRLYERSVESSEPRSIAEVFDDVNTYLGRERGSFSMENITHEQRMALQRLVADAKRMVGDITGYLTDLGFTPDQIALIRRHIDEIRKVEPETFGEVRQHWIDARAIAKGDTIIKQRKPGRGRQAPPVYKSERQMLLDAKELPRAVNEKVGFENPIRTLERIDPEGTGLKEVYFDYREAEQLYRREFSLVKQEIKAMRKDVGFKSRKRIGAFAIAQQERGANILARMKVEVPTLTEAELRVYNDFRGKFDDLFQRINRTREMIGKEPLDRVDNYFTYFRTFGVLEKAGIKINPLLERPSVVNSLYAKYGSTPFRFGIARVKKGAIPVELDPFRVYEAYTETALRHIHLSPWVAKMNELMLTLPDPVTGRLTWRLSEQKPNVHHFLRHWTNHIAGRASPMQLSPRVDRILSRLSQNLAYSVLGANARSSLIQVTALRNTVAEIGFRNTLEGVKATMNDVLTLNGKNRKFALKNSKVLDSRVYDAAVADAMRMVRGGKLGDMHQALGRWSLKPLQWLDMETAIATWNGAYKHATQGMKYNHRRAVNFADDVVTRTQASALPGDLAPIQRSAAGKAFTLFQTFVINDWGFLTRDVLGLGNVKITNKQAMQKVMRYVAATTIFNMLLEDAVGVQSPFPTPIRDLRESVENDDPVHATARKVAFGLLDPIPVVGSARYGKGPGGPVLELGTEIVAGAVGKPMARPLPESLAQAAGIPGARQVGKIRRGQARGETIYGQIVGRYEPTDSEGVRVSGGLGGLKGLGGLSGF